MAALLSAVVAPCVVACQSDTSDGYPTAPDMTTFRQQAYPVLMRDCSFDACHGAPQRFLLIFGPNRTRIDPLTHHDTPVQPLELHVSYERTVSMLASEGPAARSLLLTKPLEERAGGVSHGGVDVFNRNVYQSVEDPGYVALLTWAQNMIASGIPSPDSLTTSNAP